MDSCCFKNCFQSSPTSRDTTVENKKEATCTRIVLGILAGICVVAACVVGVVAFNPGPFKLYGIPLMVTKVGFSLALAGGLILTPVNFYIGYKKREVPPKNEPDSRSLSPSKETEESKQTQRNEETTTQGTPRSRLPESPLEQRAEDQKSVSDTKRKNSNVKYSPSHSEADADDEEESVHSDDATIHPTNLHLSKSSDSEEEKVNRTTTPNTPEKSIGDGTSPQETEKADVKPKGIFNRWFGNRKKTQVSTTTASPPRN